MKVRRIRKRAQKRIQERKRLIWWLDGPGRKHDALRRIKEGFDSMREAIQTLPARMAETLEQVKGEMAKKAESEAKPLVGDYIAQMQRVHDQYMRNRTRSA